MNTTDGNQIEEQIGQNSQVNSYEVHIAGLPLKLRTTHAESTVRELVHLVDSRVHEALSVHSNISFQNAVMLAALHLAEDLVFLKKGAITRLDQIETKAKSALSVLSGSPLEQLNVEN